MIYRAEIRFDVEADSPEQAAEIALSKVTADDAEVTAVFDENWNEA